MQEKKRRQTNESRTAQMRAKLLESARTLFISKGYAEASTPEIVRSAKATRGALYHHFDDKAALFRAVLEAEAQALAAEINASARRVADPNAALLEGARGFFDAMRVPGRARLLLVDGPAVLGWDAMDDLDDGAGRATLKDGLAAAGVSSGAALDAMALVLSAAFDRAALAISEGADEAPLIAALTQLLNGIHR